MLSAKVKEEEILFALHKLDSERWFEVLDFIGYLNSQASNAKPERLVDLNAKPELLVEVNESLRQLKPGESVTLVPPRAETREKANKSKHTASTPRKHMTAADLLNSEIVGMWGDREDIDDSVTFANQLRQKAEHRQRDENASA